MENRITDFDAAQTVRMHEALTPELLRHYYPEAPFPAIHPLASLYAAVTRWVSSQLKMR